MTTTVPDLMGQAITSRKIMNQPVGSFTPSGMKTQLRLIIEEYDELIEAYGEATSYIQNKRARINLLKELADLVYVSFQFEAAAGWPLDEALDRVNQSNKSKLVDGKALKREDGKVLKGPNYKPTNLEDLN